MKRSATPFEIEGMSTGLVGFGGGVGRFHCTYHGESASRNGLEVRTYARMLLLFCLYSLCST